MHTKTDRSSPPPPIKCMHTYHQGIMGIEAPIEYGGVGLNFTASCLAVEEIARVDPSVSTVFESLSCVWTRYLCLDLRARIH